MKWQVPRLPARILKYAKKRPLSAFLALLAILLLFIIGGKFLTKPKEQPTTSEVKAKDVTVYSIGSVPLVTVQAQVEKSGTIKIVAQTSGIISQINAAVGQNVSGGTTLVSLSTNYQGGNATSIQRQIAARSYQNVVDTEGLQKDLIGKQRDLANKGADNAGQLRDITNRSLDETRSLISLNNDIISTLNGNINTLQANNVNGANDTLILQSKQLLSQFTSANNQ